MSQSGREGRPLALVRSGTLCERVLRVLGRRFDGVQVLDRDVSITPELRADFAALDVQGRLLLGLVVEDEGQSAALAAVQALAFARGNVAALAGHLQAPQLRADLDPCVVVVARAFAADALAHLSTLDPDAVCCLELRAIESRSGRSDVLVSVRAHSASRQGEPSAEPATVPAAVLADVARRIERLDPAIVAESEQGELVCRWRGQTLCELGRGADRRASIPGDPRRFALEVEGQIESFLEGVVRQYLALTSPPAHAGVAAVAPPADPFDPGLILTPDELAAFREPL